MDRVELQLVAPEANEPANVVPYSVPKLIRSANDYALFCSDLYRAGLIRMGADADSTVGVFFSC